MDERYQTDLVTQVWGRQFAYTQWATTELLTVDAQRRVGVIPDNSEVGFLLTAPTLHFDLSRVAQIAEIERRTQHDVAAFLELLRDYYNNAYPQGGEPGRWLHFGLTSSDIVDTAQGVRFREVEFAWTRKLQLVRAALDRWMDDETPIMGITHGQVAEPTSVKARATGWAGLLWGAEADLIRTTTHLQVCKLSGPVGTFAHNPPEVEAIVAQFLKLTPQGLGATQIAPRERLAAWASCAQRWIECAAKVAMDIRLMLLLGQARISMPNGRVASSSMPHKQNPIEAEQVAGFARLARGYAQALQPLDLWLERDISNSSVERVAVPDLWHLLFQVADRLIRVLDTTNIDRQAALNPAGWSATTKLEWIAAGHGLAGATHFARTDPDRSRYSKAGEDLRPGSWFTRHYKQGDS